MVERFDRLALAPEAAAGGGLRAGERHRKPGVICREAHAADWAKRLAPVAVHRLVAWGYRRVGSLG
jgi:hypothetical protein